MENNESLKEYESALLRAIRESEDPDAAMRFAMNVVLERLAAKNGDMPVSQVQALLRGEPIGRNKAGARTVVHRAVAECSRLLAGFGCKRTRRGWDGWLKTKKS